MEQKYILCIRECYQDYVAKLWASGIGVTLPVIHRREYIKQLFKVFVSGSIYWYVPSYKEVNDVLRNYDALELETVYVESIQTNINLNDICEYTDMSDGYKLLSHAYSHIYLCIWLKLQGFRSFDKSTQITYLNNNESSVLVSVSYTENGVVGIW